MTNQSELDEAIQKFSAYARHEGDFDELDLKEVIYDEVAERERAAIEEYKRYALPMFLLFLDGTKDWEMYNTKTLLDMFNDELTKPKEQPDDSK